MAIIKRWGLTYNDEVIVGEHRISLPKLPKNRSDILFIDKPDEEAFWQRLNDFPDFWYGFVGNALKEEDNTEIDAKATIWDAKKGTVKSLSVADTIIFNNILETEIRRFREGVYFKNVNQIEWLTPAHYCTLQWCKMSGLFRNDGYGLFLKYQRDVFYLLEHSWTLDWCTGVYFSKAKKTGLTQIIGGGYYVWAAITHFQWMLGMMAPNEVKAVGTGFAYFMYAFDNLPNPLKPKVAFRAEKGGDIKFGERGAKINSSTQANVLNSRVFTVATMVHAFDSYFPMIIWFDEFPKYFGDSNGKIEPKRIFDENINSIKDQLFIRGKSIITSYPPEQNDLGAIQGRDIFKGSKLSAIPKDSKSTPSGLICWHIPGVESIKEYHDKYGNPLIDISQRKISEELEKCKGDNAKYLATMRVFAPDENAAFNMPSSGNGMPILRLIQLLTDVQREESIDPDSLYIEGRLEWTNDLWNLVPGIRRHGEFCPVRFVPLTDEEREKNIKGKIKIFKNAPFFVPNQCLKNGRDEWGNLLPPERFERLGGFDPTQWVDKSSVERGSKSCGYTINMPDERMDNQAKRIITKILLSEYHYRTETPDETLEDIVKEIIYFGKAVMVEGNAPAFSTNLMKEKLGYYMFVKDVNGFPVLWDRWMGLHNEGDKKYSFITTIARKDDKTTITEFVGYITSYIRKIQGQKDYGATIQSSTLLNDCINLDPDDTKKSDAFMAFGYTLKALYTYMDNIVQMDDKEYEAHYGKMLELIGR